MHSEWNTHVVVWRNKPDLDTMSFDDLYNNFKIVKQETNEINTAYGVSTDNTQVNFASTQVSTASTQVSIANLSDATVYAFLANQPNGSQLVHKDLEQIHKDDLEEMDLNDTAGYDKSKVECFNCHMIGHFARECKGPRNHDSRNRNQDSSRRTINAEETFSKAMIAIYGTGFDWSYIADDEVPINMALMAFSDSEFNKSEFNLSTYKRGLSSVEEQLVFYKKNELKQEKESNQLKIENFDNASKCLDKLIGSQITNKSRKGVGFVSYNVVPPPHTGLFAPPMLDLSNSGLEEFQQPEFEGYRPKTSKSVSEDTSNEVRESPNAPLIEELVSKDKSQGPRLTVITIKGKGWAIHKKKIKDMLIVDALEPDEEELLMYDKKNSVLFTNTSNMYSVDMKNIVPKESLTYLVANATLDESMLWHRRLGHINFKTINKLVKDNLVRGLPAKCFENDQTCVACLKGKKHKAYSEEGIEYDEVFAPVARIEAIRYALTENPTIYVSLIQQFWQTATTSTPNNGEMEITTIIDGEVKIVTEASIRRHLKLEDSDGVNNLPTTKIFKQLALWGMCPILIN
ncbi:ribonuclease H-like domain-containing protein [Tanacetum coccineum]